MLPLGSFFAGPYDVRLLVISLALGSAGSLVALNFLARARTEQGRPRRVGIFAAAAVFGTAVWAVHAGALLGTHGTLKGPAAMELTGLALAVGVLSAGAVFALWLARKGRLGSTILAGALLGLGVAGLQAISAAAMAPPGTLAETLPDALFRMVIATLGLALGRRLESGPRRIAGSFFLGLATVLLLFRGPIVPETMAAMTPATAPALASVGTVVSPVAILLLAACSVVLLLDRSLSRKAREEEARLRELADAMLEGVIIHRQGIILAANASAARLLGTGAEALLGSRLSARAALGSVHAMRRHITGTVSGVSELELETAEGGVRPVEAITRPVLFGGEPAFVTSLRDAAERKQAKQQIEHLATHDALTGLANRLLLADRLDRALALCQKMSKCVACLFLDIGNFRRINDEFGHEVGDALLIEFGKRLAAAAGETDTVARLDGDAFVVLQSMAEQPEAAARLAHRLFGLIAEPVRIGKAEVSPTASIGIALAPEDGTTLESVLRNAELAERRARRQSFGSFSFFEADLDEKLRERHVLERDLRTSIGSGRFDLHYQPLFSSEPLTVVGFEALLRWNDPVRGMVMPGQFIPLAEETGLIVPIGREVLEMACTEATGWPDFLHVTVNLSPLQFRQGDLAAMIGEITTGAGLAAERLEIEITESALFEDPDRALGTLHDLKAQGVRLALDDFGTGYSSLAHLRRFPFDRLKIDRSFVLEATQSEEARAIVRVILDLARSLKLAVTAEGVETEEQLRLLRAEGCGQLQGFFLGRPVPARRVPGLLAGLLNSLPAPEPFGARPG